MFGIKSESEQLVTLLEKVTGLEFVENDGFPRKMCKSCYKRVIHFAEFNLCVKSYADQKKIVRVKRGKKVSESHSVTRARQCLQFASNQQEQLPESNVRILPEFLHPQPAVEPSKGVLILAKSGLRNSEVCELYLKCMQQCYLSSSL